MQNFNETAGGGDFYEMPNAPSAKNGEQNPTPCPPNALSSIKPDTKTITSSIVVIGLYAALFTIFSVTVQIFEFVCDIEAIVGFLLLLAGIMLGFILALDAIAQKWTKTTRIHHPLQSLLIAGIVIAMIAIGLHAVKNTINTWHCPASPQLTYVR